MYDALIVQTPVTKAILRSDLSADIARYRQHRPGTSLPVLFLTEQALWAILHYRLFSALYRSNLPSILRRAGLTLGIATQKLIEIAAGITIPYQARIGPGLYIGHYGNIILHEDVVIGHTSNISHGVTIGISGRGKRRGVPRIGNNVYIATNAVVVGNIIVGDGAVLGGNSLVNRDVAPGKTVIGVPAQEVSNCSSETYLHGIDTPNDWASQAQASWTTPIANENGHRGTAP